MVPPTAPAPLKLSDLVAFTAHRTSSIAQNPSASDLIDFGVACSADFEEEFGHQHDDVNVSNNLFQHLGFLSPMMTMTGPGNETAIDAVKQFEPEFRILSASEFTTAFTQTVRTDPILDVTPLLRFAMSPVKFFGANRSTSLYGHHMPESLRAAAIVASIRLCCIMSVLWGTFLAHQEPTMSTLYDTIIQFSRGQLPSTPEGQASPLCARKGLITGWNCGMKAVNDVFEDRVPAFSASPCTLQIVIKTMQTACLHAISTTATAFSPAVLTWEWTRGITFDVMNTAFDDAMQHLVQQVAPLEPEERPTHFSLLRNTHNVRQNSAQIRPLSSMHQSTDDEEARFHPSHVLNLPPTMLSMFGLARPSNIRRVINMPAQRPPNTDASGQPPPPTPAQIAAQQQAQRLEREKAKMRAAAERRRLARESNNRLTPNQVWDQYRHDIRKLREYVGNTGEFRFEDYDPDSDNEDELHDPDGRDAATPKEDEEQRVEVEVFFMECLGHCIDPYLRPLALSENSIYTDSEGRDFNCLLNDFLYLNMDMFKMEATRAANADEYKDHNIVILHMEKHFQMQRSLFEVFPQLRRTRNPRVIREALMDARNTDRLVLSVDSLGKSRTVTHLICSPYSASHNVRRSKIKEFPGLTACVGIIFHGKRARSMKASATTFMFCKSISHDPTEDEAIDADNDPLLDNVVVRLSVPRIFFDEFDIAKGDTVTIIPFCNLVTSLRMLKAVSEVHLLPPKLQGILWGSDFDTHPGELPNILFPLNRAEFEASLAPLPEIRALVNEGCLAYIDNLPDNICDPSQRRALLETLSEMGDMRPNSSSMSQIIGPPGCGKSHTITLLGMSMMHHSHVGHIRPGATYPCVRRNPPDLLRFSDNSSGCRILVTCSSNVGADEVARKFASQLPMGDGTTKQPFVVRVWRTNYEVEDLADISMHQIARMYDFEVYNPPEDPDVNNEPRRWASQQALRAVVNEAVIIVCTNATAGGPLLLGLKLEISAVLVDEAGHSSETETLMPIIANVRMAQQGRVHVVLVGDHKQLSPVFVCNHNAVMFVSRYRDFHFPVKMLRQFESMFERLYRTGRIRVSWLTHHYRSHPRIGRVVHKHVYSDLLHYPLTGTQFDASYNSVTGDRGLQAITIIDTRVSAQRFEGRGHGRISDGHLVNTLEAEIMNEVMFRIHDSCGNEDLSGQIIAASPYAEQTEYLQEYMSQSPRFLSRRGPGLNVLVANIDALQGSEREVAVISLTRSNANNPPHIGFLSNDGRLNVAFSRPRRLLVIIGDFSTMGSSPIANRIYDEVLSRAPRTSLQFFTPRSRDTDEVQYSVMRRLEAYMRGQH